MKLFWAQVFARWPPSFQATATDPLANKLRVFLTNPASRMMVAQSHSTIVVAARGLPALAGRGIAACLLC